MNSHLEILLPAETLAILSPEELRIAAGLPSNNSSRDEELAPLGLEAAEWVATVCGIRSAGYPPTWWAEVVRESFHTYSYIASQIVLARRFISAVTVLENNMALVEGSDFVVQPDQGILVRLANGFPIAWWAGPLVVEYTAGFGVGSPPTAMPSLIKAACSDYVRLRLAAIGANPLLRSETTVDLDSVSYRDIGDSYGAFDESTRSRLSRFLCGTPG